MSVISKVEAVLYASDEPISASDISVVINEPKEEVVKAIRDLIKTYRKNGSALVIRRMGIRYKMQLSPEYSSIVTPVSTREIAQLDLKILGFIAANKECKLGDIGRKFGEKGREALNGLISRKFIRTRKFRNTELLSPTKEFYRYFNVSEKKLDSLKTQVNGSAGESE